MLEKLKQHSKKIGIATTTAVMTLVPVAFPKAVEPDVTTAMTTAMTGVKTDSLNAIAAVAPIGISIMGAFLVWRYGLRFFKSISK